MWLMLASNILLWHYKNTLLSSLISIHYEKPMNTLEDIERSGLPVLVTKNNVAHWLMATDPRPTIKSIFKKTTEGMYRGRERLYPFPGGKFPDWVTEG